jgi:hypothetical protein
MNPVPVGAHGKVKSVLDIGKYSKIALDATEIAVGVYLAAVVAGVMMSLPLFTVQGPEMPLLEPLTYRYMFVTERRVLPALGMVTDRPVPAVAELIAPPSEVTPWIVSVLVVAPERTIFGFTLNPVYALFPKRMSPVTVRVFPTPPK